MFTQPRDPNNKNNPAYRKITLFVTVQIFPSQLVPKNNMMTKTKKRLMLDQNFLKNRLRNSFVLPLMIQQNDMVHDIKGEVHHEIFIITKRTVHKTETILH